MDADGVRRDREMHRSLRARKISRKLEVERKVNDRGQECPRSTTATSKSTAAGEGARATHAKAKPFDTDLHGWTRMELGGIEKCIDPYAPERRRSG